jgi:CubicO group peptidase (beta-lactamase class C family)
MTRSRKETWLLLIVVGFAAIPLAILGLWGFMITTARVLHPTAADVRSVPGAVPPTDWAGAVEEGRRVIRAALKEQNLPGLSVAVGAGGRLLWAEGFGWADLDSQLPVTPDTRFRIGTASMPLTSAAVGLLMEAGRLKLEEQIQTYVPEFPRKDWPLTLRQLMAHVAGVRNDGGDEGPLLAQYCDRPVEALEYFADRPLLFEPETDYRLSSYGWILVSAAIEAAADEPFVTFMSTRIFEPLGMRGTMTDDPTEPIENRATSYFPRFAGDPRWGLHLMRPIDLSCYAGASAFLSTPSDLVRFGMAVNGGTLLKPETVELLQTPQRLATGEQTGYGLGWDVETVTLAREQTRWVGHGGTLLGGPAVALMTFPEHGIVVAVTSNISYTDAEAVASEVAQAFAAPRK